MRTGNSELSWRFLGSRLLCAAYVLSGDGTRLVEEQRRILDLPCSADCWISRILFTCVAKPLHFLANAAGKQAEECDLVPGSSFGVLPTISPRVVCTL